MQKILVSSSCQTNKLNYFEQCHKFWVKFEEIPNIRVRKYAINPKKPSAKDLSIANKTPSPTRYLYNSEKIRRQTSISLKRKKIYYPQISRRKTTRNSIISVPSISFDYS
jgi:hypothetical protein